MKVFQVDAFAEKPFEGNPAAVCLLTEERPDSWMQSVAQEMNLSETAFLLKDADAYRLRWFTPQQEVTLCGHATLASAHILWEQGILEAGAEACFDTLSGRLTASLTDGLIQMDFPARPVLSQEAPPGLLKAMGVEATSVSAWKNLWLIEMADADEVRAAEPDFSDLRAVQGVLAVILTSRGQGEYDFVSRFFAPAVGINEDPVTGSAHCSLAPYWADRLGRDVMIALQASRRGGVLRCQLAPPDRVVIGGTAVTVVEGRLLS